MLTAQQINKEKTVDLLNDLIVKCYDSKEAYWKGVEILDDPELKRIFTNYVQQRKEFILELEKELAAHGGKMETGTSFKGQIRQMWMRLKALFSQNDQKAVFEECKESEKNIMEAYREAIDANVFRPSTRSVVEEQWNRIKGSLASLRAHEFQYV